MPHRATCSVLYRGYDSVLIHDETSEVLDIEDTPCIRPDSHFGSHLFKTPLGRYIAWKNDMRCGCCGPDEDDRCTLHWEVKDKEEIEELLNGRD